MEDEEAEAVLMTLGAVLPWEPRKTLAWLPKFRVGIVARSSTGEYCVLEHRTKGFRRVYKASYRALISNHYVSDDLVVGYEVDRPPHEYEHRAAAIAACERHHATGNWK